MTAAVDRHPIVFVGLPLRSWAFAIRIWLAVILALYISFWLELEAPSSAAVTAAILALPTRGQVLEKAVFRLIATAIGVAASITIVSLFAQTGGLLLVAFAAWLGVCVYGVGMLDGNRAYAAALSGYTVAIIAVQQIDNPQHVFESAMARGAAITVGVLTVTILNDLLIAPDGYPHLATQLETLRRRIADYVQCVLHGEAMPGMTAAGLLREIVALRPEIGSLAAELSSGPARSAAARSAMVGLVAELFAARALETLSVKASPTLRVQIISEPDASSGAVALWSREASANGQRKDSHDVLAQSLSWFSDHVLRIDDEVRESLEALSAARRLPRAWRAPLYRSRRIAAETGIKAAVYFLLAAAFFAVSGWSSTDVSLSFIAIVIGLGATTPDLRAFTMIAVVAALVASLMAGMLEFVVLDGATAFPLLAIGLAPFLIGATLLMTLPNRILSALGRLNLVFILLLLAPSNPQTYNPKAFLFSVLFLLLATGLLFAAEIFVPTASNDRRRHWLLASARRNLHRLPSHRKQDLAPEEAMFRDAGRVAQILAAGGDVPQHRPAMEEAMAIFDQAATLRLCEDELDRLTEGPLRPEVGAAYMSLVNRDPGAIVASADALNEAASIQDISVAGASAALVLASVTFTSRRPGAEFSAETKS